MAPITCFVSHTLRVSMRRKLRTGPLREPKQNRPPSPREFGRIGFATLEALTEFHEERGSGGEEQHVEFFGSSLLSKY